MWQIWGGRGGIVVKAVVCGSEGRRFKPRSGSAKRCRQNFSSWTNVAKNIHERSRQMQSRNQWTQRRKESQGLHFQETQEMAVWALLEERRGRWKLMGKTGVQLHWARLPVYWGWWDCLRATDVEIATNDPRTAKGRGWQTLMAMMRTANSSNEARTKAALVMEGREARLQRGRKWPWEKGKIHRRKDRGLPSSGGSGKPNASGK